MNIYEKKLNEIENKINNFNIKIGELEQKLKNNVDKNNKNDNNITMKIIFSLLLVFFINLVIYCIFTVFRKCERKRKGKIFEELFL